MNVCTHKTDPLTQSELADKDPNQDKACFGLDRVSEQGTQTILTKKKSRGNKKQKTMKQNIHVLQKILGLKTNGKTKTQLLNELVEYIETNVVLNEEKIVINKPVQEQNEGEEGLNCEILEEQEDVNDEEEDFMVLD